MFERGRVVERGLRPLSYKLPSPARNNSEGSLVVTGWRGFTLKVLPEGDTGERQC